jgi:hypothetical protein
MTSPVGFDRPAGQFLGRENPFQLVRLSDSWSPTLEVIAIRQPRENAESSRLTTEGKAEASRIADPSEIQKIS